MMSFLSALLPEDLDTITKKPHQRNHFDQRLVETQIHPRHQRLHPKPPMCYNIYNKAPKAPTGLDITGHEEIHNSRSEGDHPLDSFKWPNNTLTEPYPVQNQNLNSIVQYLPGPV